MALSTDQYGYLIDPLVPITDATGRTIKDGFLRVYIAGSSTPVITYRNFDGAVNEKTIELDNSGRCKYPVIVSKSLAYKVVVYDAQHSQETPIITVDKMFAIGANITAGAGATVVTGLDGLTTKPDGFVDASVIGTDGYVALDHTLVTDDLDTDAKATAVENDRYIPLLNNDVNDPDSKITLGRLWQWVLGKIKSLSTTITAFRTGDVIPVDGPSGTAKMGKDNLLTITQKSALDRCLKLDLSSPNVSATAGVTIDKRSSLDNVYIPANTEFEYKIECTTGMSDAVQIWVNGGFLVTATSLNTWTKTTSNSDITSIGYRITSDHVLTSGSIKLLLRGGDVNKLYDEVSQNTKDIQVVNLQKESPNVSATAGVSVSKHTILSDVYIPANTEFEYKIECTTGMSDAVQIWVNDSFFATISDLNTWITATKNEDITSIGFGITSAHVLTSGDVKILVRSGKINKLTNDVAYLDNYCKRTSVKQETDVFAVSQGVALNKDNAFTGLIFKANEKFQYKFVCTNDAVDAIQVWVNGSYSFSATLLNSWQTVSINSDVVSIGFRITSEHALDSGSIQMQIRGGVVGLTNAEIDEIQNYQLPTYYTKQWEDAVVSSVCEKTEVSDVSFAFCTDFHFRNNKMHSKGLIKMLLDRTSLPFCILGGDYPYAYGDEAEVKESMSLVRDYFDFIGKNRLFSIRGNHDFTIKFDAGQITGDPNTGYTAPASAAYDVMAKPSEFIVDSVEHGKFYFNIDLPASKTRIMMLCSCDTQTNDTTASWGVTAFVTTEQKKWLCDKILEKTGWNYIFVSHIPFDPNLPYYDASQADFYNIALALHNGTSITIGCETFDFSSCGNKFVMGISGHSHLDASDATDGILCVVTTGDGTLNDGNSRVRGTTTEQAIDVYNIDYTANKVYAVRVGGGSSREWNL